MERRSSLVAQPVLRIAVVIFVIVTMQGLCPLPPAFGSRLCQQPEIDAKTNYVPGELLVKLEEGTTELSDASQVLSAAQLSSAVAVPDLEIWKLEVPAGEEMEQVRQLEALPGVEYAEPNYYAYAQETPNDPAFGNQWGLQKIHAPEGWDFTRGSSSVVIAVIDTGIDGTHQDLADKVMAGYNFVADPDVAIPAHSNSDDNYHGTHVAGIAAAITDNGIGVAGVSWESLLMPVKVLNASGQGLYKNVASGVRYAADHGAKVINMSLGGSSYSETLEAAVEYAYGKGCLLTAASGNYSDDELLYPARFDHVMAVGNSTQDDVRNGNSNYGAGLSVMAPGTLIYSTLPGGGYGMLTGTSMACPHVSGLAALVWAVDPGATSAEVQQLIEETAVDLGAAGWDIYTGYGRIDTAAIRRLFGALDITPTHAAYVADVQTPPLPGSQIFVVQPAVASATTITWTLTVSPTTASWITATPAMGTVSGQQGDAIELGVTTEGLEFGKHSCELLFTGHSEVGTSTSSVGIDLYYVSELTTLRLLNVVKDYTY